MLSVLVGVVILGVKLVAYWLSGSTAIFADALESVVHVVITVTMFFCLRYAQKPADEDHPYGHGRIEIVSIILEGGMVFLTALAVFWTAISNLIDGHEFIENPLSMGLMIVAMLINGGLGWHLIKTGKTYQSKILVADGHHVLADVWTSIGATVGFVLAWLGDMPWIDPVAALLLACVVLKAGIGLIRDAVKTLMDEADPELNSQVVDAINNAPDPCWLDVHNLRSRNLGDHIHVDFHLVIPGEWTVRQAHHVMHELESHILSSLNKTGSVMIHLDPPEEVADTLELGDHTSPGSKRIQVEDAIRTESD